MDTIEVLNDLTVTLDQLEAFVTVAQHEHVTRAAADLGLAQSSVSHQLRCLEAALGLALFERVGRGVRLTDDGRALVGPAAAVLAARRSFLDATHARTGLMVGRLAIAASNTVGIYRLPDWLAGFVARFPGIAVNVRLVNTHEAITMVRDAAVDCALVEGPESRQGLDELEVEVDELVTVAAPDHPLARRGRVRLAELSRHRYLAREPGSGTEALAAQLLGSSYRRGPVLELGQVDAVRAAAVAGLGYAVISLAAVADDLATGRLCLLQTGRPRLTRALAALRRPGSHSPTLEAFWSHLATLAGPAEGPVPPGT